MLILISSEDQTVSEKNTKKNIGGGKGPKNDPKWPKKTKKIIILGIMGISGPLTSTKNIYIYFFENFMTL